MLLKMLKRHSHDAELALIDRIYLVRCWSSAKSEKGQRTKSKSCEGASKDEFCAAKDLVQDPWHHSCPWATATGASFKQGNALITYKNMKWEKNWREQKWLRNKV